MLFAKRHSRRSPVTVISHPNVAGDANELLPGETPLCAPGRVVPARVDVDKTGISPDSALEGS